MFKNLATAAAALVASAGISHAATVVEADIFGGTELGFAQILNGDDDFQFLISNLASEAQDIFVEISASGDIDNLENILVGIGMGVDEEDTDGTFENATQSLNIVPRENGVNRGAATFLFDSFTSMEAFSVFVVSDDTLEGPTPFTVSIFATPDGVDQVIPVPGAGILLATAIGGFAVARRRRSNA